MRRLTWTTASLVVDRRRDGGLGHLGCADQIAVEERLVREVEQVVDQQPVAGVEELHAVDMGPCLVGDPRDVGEPVEVGGLRIAHPDPDPRPTLGDRTRRDAGPRRDAILARHVRAPPVGCEAQAVIAAPDLVAAQRARRQRIAAVRAPVVEADHDAVGGAVQHDRFTAHRAPDRVRCRCSPVDATTYQLSSSDRSSTSSSHRPSPFPRSGHKCLTGGKPRYASARGVQNSLR